MKKITLIFLAITFFYTSSHSQELILHKDFPGIKWPFLWDMEQDQNGNLYVCSELGALFIKTNGVWQEYALDDNIKPTARGIAIDKEGIVWIATEEGLFSFANGAVLEHFTSANSSLPSDDLRELRAYDNKLWIILNGNGIAVKEGNSFTHLKETNSQLQSNFIDDIEISENGRIVIATNEIVYFVNGNNWTTHNFEDKFGYQTTVSDIFIDHNQDVWFATRRGIIKYINSTSNFQNLKSTYGINDYTAILYTPKNELWIGELYNGLHYNDDKGNKLFFKEDNEGRPSQVFDFIYYQDTVRVIGNIGATVTGLTVDLTSSILETNSDFASIYPNPVCNILTLEINKKSDFNVVLRSSDGSLIFKGLNKKEIDLSLYSNGIYYLTINDPYNNMSETHKVVVLK